MKNKVRYKTESTIQRTVDTLGTSHSGAAVPGGQPMRLDSRVGHGIGQGCRHPTPGSADTPLDGQAITRAEDLHLDIRRVRRHMPRELAGWALRIAPSRGGRGVRS